MRQTKNAIYMLIHSYSSLLKNVIMWGGVSLLIINPVFAEDIDWKGDIDVSGNATYSGTKLEVYDNIKFHTYGTAPDGLGAGYSGVEEGNTYAWVVTNNSLTANENVEIVNTVKDNTNNEVGNNRAIYAKYGAKIDFTVSDNIYLASVFKHTSWADSIAITAKGGNSEVKISGKTVQIIGSVDVSSRLDNDNFYGNNVTLELTGKDSFWYGSAIGESVYTTPESEVRKNWVDVTLKDGASWIYHRRDRLDNLTLDNGVVILDDDIIAFTYANTEIILTEEEKADGTPSHLFDYRGTNKHTEVTITNLKGAGLFKIDLDWATNKGEQKESDLSDFINIINSQEGTQQRVEFNHDKAHLMDMSSGDRLYFALVQDDKTSFVTSADGLVENRADEVNDFYYGTESEIINKYGTDYTYYFLTKKAFNYNNENVTFTKGATQASYLLATEMDTLNKRRGESRYVTGTNNGLWLRYSYTDTGLDNILQMDKSMVQLGYDRYLLDNHGKHYVGVAFDYTDASIDIDDISGNNDSKRYALNLYYTYLIDNGAYVDVVFKGGVVDSSYDVSNASGSKIGTDLEQWFYGGSVEGGYKYDFSNQFFVEPQVQLQLTHLDGDRFTTEGGLKGKIDAISSLIGRAGFRAGYNFNLNNEVKDSLVYFKADVLHEFNARRGIYMQGKTTMYEESFSGDSTWYDVGMGVDLAVRENTKLWCDVEHSFGGDLENSWQFNVGARYEF